VTARAVTLWSIPVAVLVVAALGCHPAAHGSSAVKPDSITGVVSVVGTSFEQQLVLRSGNMTTLLTATAPDSAALARLAGAEVLIVGTRTRKSFRVEDVTAISVAGAPVVDGRLILDGGQVVVETATGHVPLGNPPAAFRNMIGARVWIGGPLDKGPNTYGVIVPAR
jgi:hypothetical protein